jgi:hypothetical protein
VDVAKSLINFGIDALAFRDILLRSFPDRTWWKVLFRLLPPTDIKCEFNPVAQILFVENAADVTLYRPQTEMELCSNLFVREPARHGFGDAPLRVR